MAKDIFHAAVKKALVHDGWTITHDPYVVRTLGTNASIDLGAEQLIGANKDSTIIAIEIKSFIGPSLVYDFHLALGQYMNYKRALLQNDPERLLYLAVTNSVYEIFFLKPDVMDAVQTFQLNLIVFDDATEKIVHWLIQ